LSSDNPDLDDLTDAERETLSAPAVEDTSAADAAKAAADAEKAKADEAAAKAAEDAAAVKPAAEAKPAPSPRDAPTFVPKVAGAASGRDYDKELSDLEAKYADPDGGVTLEEYNKQSRAIQRAQLKEEVLQEVEANTQASAKEFQTNLFNTAVKNFFDTPANQEFKVDDKGNPPPEFRAAFQKACDFVDDPSLSNADVVSRAYATLKLTRPELFKEPEAKTDPTPEELAAAAAKEKADKDAAAKLAKEKQDAINARKPPTKDLPVTLGQLPNAGEDQDQDSTIDKLAAMDITELEDAMANMKPGDVEDLLKKTPGSSTRGKADK
jgi:hypothetical protein